MRTPFGNPEAVAREIGGRFRPDRDKIVRATKFGIVAKALWPDNTDAELATIGGVDVRTARRWLTSEFDPPIEVVIAVVVATFSRK